ncbi:MDR family oxidoreductase [uncultured Pseudoteredinibacter sp.]|uniref:acrylyl-CoA reductase (NADPH) n=1 Tax=uncultured Pseudoteredinibacter sp. TaxID=1641701 RepID=UPI002622E501|nr:MDR family oxidoreductase [uncultured Pseudoteredinibacter sp.]
MKALQLIKTEDAVNIEINDINESQLPDGEVLVDVDYSSLNYKDSLALNGRLPSIRNYPMVPGIDFAGTVIESSSEAFSAGDKVVLNGWGVGENHWGGYAQKARVQASQLVALPEAFTTRQAMAIGTAGYTAMLCVMALEKNGVTPDQGEVLVTGAAGGVGSVAISILSKLGYTVVASTGRASEEAYLKSLGASSIIDRNELSEPGRPLNKERWAAAVDAVGSHTLANICASLKYDGVVAATGLAQGSDLPATVMPFILRGVTLAGVDSVMAPKARREEAWRRLAEDLDVSKLEAMTEELGLADLAEATAQQLKGVKTHGRTVVNVNL